MITFEITFFKVCPKSFSYRESLVTHSSLHTGVKPYICEGCGNRFSCIGNLIKHRRSRPDSCGLPQFKNKKIAPRASAKNQGSLTRKYCQKISKKVQKLGSFVMYVPITPPTTTSSVDTVDIPSTYSTISIANKVISTSPKKEELPIVHTILNERNILPDKIEEPIYYPFSAKPYEITVSTTTENDHQYVAHSSSAENNAHINLEDVSDCIKFENIMNDLKEIKDQEHEEDAFICNPENMDIVSNVEIEYITSDEMNAAIEIEVNKIGDPGIKSDIAKEDTEFDNQQYEINFIQAMHHPQQTEAYVDSWQDDVHVG